MWIVNTIMYFMWVVNTIVYFMWIVMWLVKLYVITSMPEMFWLMNISAHYNLNAYFWEQGIMHLFTHRIICVFIPCFACWWPWLPACGMYVWVLCIMVDRWIHQCAWQMYICLAMWLYVMLSLYAQQIVTWLEHWTLCSNEITNMPEMCWDSIFQLFVSRLLLLSKVSKFVQQFVSQIWMVCV